MKTNSNGYPYILIGMLFLINGKLNGIEGSCYLEAASYVVAMIWLLTGIFSHNTDS
jgi:hypothetical protein